MTRSSVRRGLEVAAVSGFVGFLVWAVVRQWTQVQAVIGRLDVSVIAPSIVAVLAGIWCSMLCWRAILADFGSRVPLAGSVRIFFVGQAGKYVPGKVWPIVAQVRLGRDYGVPGRASAAAALVFMVMILGTALLVGVASLPITGTGAIGEYWWALLALPMAAVALWPPVLNRGLAWVTRLARRDPMPRPLTASGIGRAFGWAVAMWLLYGVHLWLLLVGLDVNAPNLVLRAAGAFAAAWAVGFLMLITPAGVGTREVAMVLLLGPTVAQPAAVVAAVISRLLMTVGDLMFALCGLLVTRWRRPDSAGVLTSPRIDHDE